jgi:hypothetical protein
MMATVSGTIKWRMVKRVPPAGLDDPKGEQGLQETNADTTQRGW